MCGCMYVCIYGYTVKPLNSGHLWVLENLSVINRCPLLGGNCKKIVIFGTKFFVSYPWHVRSLGYPLLGGFTVDGWIDVHLPHAPSFLALLLIIIGWSFNPPEPPLPCLLRYQTYLKLSSALKFRYYFYHSRKVRTEIGATNAWRSLRCLRRKVIAGID